MPKKYAGFTVREHQECGRRLAEINGFLLDLGRMQSARRTASHTRLRKPPARLSGLSWTLETGCKNWLKMRIHTRPF